MILCATDCLGASADRIGVPKGRNVHHSLDLLGRVYNYFLTRFASAEGKNGGQFYTPSCVVRRFVGKSAPRATASHAENSLPNSLSLAVAPS